MHKLTPELLLKGALANQHRYKPEPLLSRTGTGSLSPTTKADLARDRKVRKSVHHSLLKSASASKAKGF